MLLKGPFLALLRLRAGDWSGSRTTNRRLGCHRDVAPHSKFELPTQTVSRRFSAFESVLVFQRKLQRIASFSKFHVAAIQLLSFGTNRQLNGDRDSSASSGVASWSPPSHTSDLPDGELTVRLRRVSRQIEEDPALVQTQEAKPQAQDRTRRHEHAVNADTLRK